MWITNLKILGLGTAVVLFYTVVAHTIPQLESEVPQALSLSGDFTPAALAAAGEQVYTGAGGCTACHGLGTRAPNLLTDHAGQGAIGARCLALGARCMDYLHTSLIDPGDSLVPGFANIMPDMRRQLGDPQAIWALVAYLQSQGGEITVTADEVEAAVAEAAAAGGTTGSAQPAARSTTTDPRQLLQETGCLACHVIDGAGPPIGPPFDGMGSRLNANQIREAILDPNATIARGYEQFAGVMPPNFGEQLSAAQLEAIVRFLAARR